MAKAKKVGFNFFKPLTQLKNKKVVPVKLKPILDLVMSRYQQAKASGEKNYKYVYAYNNEPARLSDITLDVETQFYHLVFERLDYVLPKYTTLHGDSKELELQDDEFIGHDVSVLYDPDNHILMIQRNRTSLGPSGIELFLRTLLIDSETTDNFELAMISDTTAKKRAFKQSAYRKIFMRVTGVKANGIVEKLTGKKSDVHAVEISFNASPKKQDKLDDQFSKTVLEEYIEDEDVKSLQIRAREEDDSIVEPIDLIDQKLQAYTYFRFDEKRHLNPISVFEEMINIYTEDEHGGYKKKILRM